MKRTIATLLILLLCFTGSAFAGRKKPRTKRKPARIVKPHPSIYAIEKLQLIKGVKDDALLYEIERRWLAIFTLEELQDEAIRRKLKP
jgi:hypothetical protein